MQPNFEIIQSNDTKEPKSGNNYAKFTITPLANGYGNTLGTALRRVLLSSLPGAAITTVRIQGVKHQFSTLKGMKEDVVEFLMNLKNLYSTATRLPVTFWEPAKTSANSIAIQSLILLKKTTIPMKWSSVR